MKKKQIFPILTSLLLFSCSTTIESSTPSISSTPDISSQDSSSQEISSEEISSQESSTEESSTVDVEQLNDLQYVFYNLSQGNFSVQYTLHYANSTRDGEQTASYTDYAIETDGYFGFSSVAQGDGLIFSYEREEGEIDSTAPVLNSSSGLRYLTIDEYRPIFRNINLDALPSETDEDGYYTYEFGVDHNNDEMMVRICMLYSSYTFTPASMRMRPIGNSLVVESVGIVYDAEQGIEDRIVANFNQIGTTEIEDVKAYLDNGGTAKDFISDRFVAFMLPYLVSQNYSVDVDITNITDVYGTLPTKKYSKIYTEEVEFSYVDEIASGSGYMSYSNMVFSFNLNENNDVVFGMAAGDGTDAFTDLWSEEIGTSFLDVAPSNLTGYMTYEDDVNHYHITDTYFITAICNLGNLGNSDYYYPEECIITIDDFDKGDFTVQIPYSNITNHTDLGYGIAKFHSRDTTVFEPTDRLLGIDLASEEGKTDLQSALDLFGTDRYMQYVPTTDFYMTNCIYNEDYTYSYYTTSGYSSGSGYILDTDSIVKEVTVSSADEVTLGSSFAGPLPGTGATFGNDYDLGYFSHPVVYANGTIDESLSQEARTALLDADSYVVDDTYGDATYMHYYNRNNPDAIDLWASSYFSSITSGYNFLGIGLRVHLQGEDTSSAMNKLNFYIYVYDSSAAVYSTYFSFYNLGSAAIPALETYLG